MSMKKIFFILACLPFSIILHAQNVGIGTTVPVAKLDVMGAARSGTHPTDKLVYFTGNIGEGKTGDGGFEIRHSNSLQGIGFGYNTIYQTGTDVNSVLNIRALGTGAITLNAVGGATGNVGIGTAAPAQALHVINNTRVDGNIFVDGANTNNGTYSSNALLFGNSGSSEGIASKRTAGGNQSGLDFYTLGTNRMAITSGGNVGIGTTNPIEKLSVSGNITVTGVVKQANYSSSGILPVSSSQTFAWVHNFGYQPVIMCTLERTSGQSIKNNVMYEQIDNNSLKITVTNNEAFLMLGYTVHWIVVN